MQSLIAMMRFKFHHLFAYSLFISTLYIQPSQAVGVSFDLKTATAEHQVVQTVSSQSTTPAIQLQQSEITPNHLAVSHPPSQPIIRVHQPSRKLPQNAVASARILPAAPLGAVPTSQVFTPVPSVESHALQNRNNAHIGLQFQQHQSRQTEIGRFNHSDIQASKRPDWIYAGESNSLVARVIGSAEGTRTASGQRTRAYYGHTDPGNGVWNLGTFSYQHGAASPEEADRKQLKRLQRQGDAIAYQAKTSNLNMSLGEILNGLDLANQAPLAALDRGGYVDRLVQARQQGLKDSDAIVWARTYSYVDPKTQRWNAPGLGNTLSSIKQDQRRRHDAVAQALNHYRAELPTDFHETTPLSLDNSNIAQLSEHRLSRIAAGDQTHSAPVETLPKPPEATPIDFGVAFEPTSETGAPTSSGEPKTTQMSLDASTAQLSSPIHAIPLMGDDKGEVDSSGPVDSLNS